MKVKALCAKCLRKIQIFICPERSLQILQNVFFATSHITPIKIFKHLNLPGVKIKLTAVQNELDREYKVSFLGCESFSTLEIAEEEYTLVDTLLLDNGIKHWSMHDCQTLF